MTTRSDYFRALGRMEVHLEREQARYNRELRAAIRLAIRDAGDGPLDDFTEIKINTAIRAVNDRWYGRSAADVNGRLSRLVLFHIGEAEVP